MAATLFTIGIAVILISLVFFIPALYFAFRAHRQQNLKGAKKPWYKSASIVLPLSTLEMMMTSLFLGFMGLKRLPGSPVLYTLEIILPLIGIAIVIYAFLLVKQKSL